MEQLLHTHTSTQKAIEEPIDVSSRERHRIDGNLAPHMPTRNWRDISKGTVCILAHPMVNEKTKQTKKKKKKKQLSSLKNI